jgi:hypothetical protein
MLARRQTLALGGALLCAWALSDGASRVEAAPPAAQAAPPVALIATRGGHSELYHARAGQPLGAPLASLSHREGGDLRAAMLPDGTVLATAPWAAGRDRSFDGALFRLEGGAELLCDDVVHASSPLVMPDGRVFVARGRAGRGSASSMRIDALRIDAIDPASGAATTLHRYRGYLLHLAGAHDGRVIVYRVGPGSADLVAIDASGRMTTLLSPLLPFARDFSVDAQRIVFRGRHQSDSRTWVVDALDLTSGALTRLHQGPSFSLAPHVWPDGGVAINQGQSGLSLLGSRDSLRAPLGPGVDRVRAFSSDARFVAALHTRAGELAVPFVLDRRSGKGERLPAPARTRVAIAGFVEAAP